MTKIDPSSLEFEVLHNDGQPPAMRKLIELKNVFSKQLPKMPKEYIVRLIFSKNHEAIAVRQGSKILGGVCYCLFPGVRLCEIVFLAISSEHQTCGLGTRLMNHLKTHMQKKSIEFLMTCADNLAIGYFKKQGFHRNITMPPELFKGYLKDYEGSTLMEFLLHPHIDYFRIAEMVRDQQKYLVEVIKSLTTNHILYAGIPESGWRRASNAFGTRLSPSCIPGLAEAGFTAEEFDRLRALPRGKSFKESCLKIVDSLTGHSSAWPFLAPVRKEEVPDYFNYIKRPMDFQTIRDRVNSNEYSSKKQFEGDIMLVFSNAKEYNSKPTVFYKCADKMEVYAKGLLENLKDAVKEGKLQSA